MKYFEFGQENKTTLLLLHGMCCSWEIAYKDLIAIAEEKYHVIAIATDGYNPNEPEVVLTTTEAEIKKDADWIVTKFDGNIDIMYGSSQGGLFMMGLLRDERIHVKTAIFDGFAVPHIPGIFSGILCKPIAKFATKLMMNIIHKHPSLMVKPLGLKNVAELQSLMYTGFSEETLYNNMVEMLTYKFTDDKFEGFNRTNTFIFNGSNEKAAIKNVHELKDKGYHITSKVFDNAGHGSMLKRPSRLLSEIDKAFEESIKM